MTGRPSTFTVEIADEICGRLAEGESLRAICRDSHLPSEGTVRGWVVDDREGFSAQYARARDIGLEHMADEILEISDETSRDTISTERGDMPDHEWIARSRLRVDARKWLLSKRLPKTYGDKVQTEHSGPDGGPITNLTITATDPVEAAREYQRLIRGE